MNAGSERRWQAARLAALFLVLVQCASLGLLEEGHLFATIMGGIACLSLVRRFQIEPQQAPHWMWFAALALIQAVKHRVAPEEINEQITFFNTVAAYEAARFLIFLQSVQLFVRRPGGRIPTWVAGIACLSMVLASNVRLNSETRPLCMALSLTFVGGLAIFAALNRRRATSGGDPIGRWLAGGALGLVLLAATGITHAFQRLEGKLERWLSEQAMFDRGDDATSGFSGRGQIGDITRWKNRDADRVALRVHSEQTPGYLRGMVFDDLRGRLWADTAEVRRLGEYRSRRLPASHNNERIYRLHPHAYEAHVSEPMEFWPETRTGDRLFLPMEAAFLSAAADAIVVNGHGLVIRTGAGDGAPYTAMLDTSPDERPLSDEDRRRYLVVNPHLQPQLEPFLEEIFGNAETSLEKTERLTGFFRQNFRYALTAQTLYGRDPVVNFLTERHPAHCEYFATAGTMMLRVAGVPSRYVTGYVATERNPHGDFWVARRKDAHAWIEAYDDARHRWFVVECTPPDGIPQSDAGSGYSAWWDASLHTAREWLHRATSGGPEGFLVALWSVFTSVPGLALMLLGAAGFTVWKLRQGRSGAFLRRDAPLYPALLRELGRAERLARRLGFDRRPAETLSAFSARLRRGAGDRAIASSALADWYDEYVRVRYGAQEAVAHADELAARLRAIRASARRR